MSRLGRPALGFALWDSVCDLRTRGFLVSHELHESARLRADVAPFAELWSKVVGRASGGIQSDASAKDHDRVTRFEQGGRHLGQ